MVAGVDLARATQPRHFSESMPSCSTVRQHAAGRVSESLFGVEGTQDSPIRKLAGVTSLGGLRALIQAGEAHCCDGARFHENEAGG